MSVRALGRRALTRVSKQTDLEGEVGMPDFSHLLREVGLLILRLRAGFLGKYTRNGAPPAPTRRVDEEGSSLARPGSRGRVCAHEILRFHQPLAARRERPDSAAWRPRDGFVGLSLMGWTLLSWAERKRKRAAMLPTLSNSGLSFT